MSAWVDAGFQPFEGMLTRVQTQTHRRFLKSHLPFDGIPYNEDTKYIVVCRDGRDIFMSIWNHYSNYSDAFLKNIRARATRLGIEYPDAPDNINTFWKNCCTKS